MLKAYVDYMMQVNSNWNRQDALKIPLPQYENVEKSKKVKK